MNQSVAVTAIQHGICPSPFNFSISNNPSQTLATLMSHAQKYINAKEAQAQLRDEEERLDRKGRDKEERKLERSNRDHKRQDRRPDHIPRTPPPTYRNFTPLNIPLSKVLVQIHDHSYVRWPEKMKTQGNKRNHDKYCKFHRDHGHDTENCFDLRNHIEDLIRHGYLGGFIDKSEKPTQQEQRTEIARPPPRAPPASAIHGHKKKRNQLITFTNDDLRGVQAPYDDALLITAEVANFEMRRILVDTGSSTDVLFDDAFEKLGIDKE
ncbi:PREDICTED: uncharacterized protein LOC104588977 [Nelumbo nucifera]|uniref:Uncharacterized protein LOC104588977 n=1 Tax=Nelumbo nucifera TaxID=4432 RepID=A0A1U7Z0C9_NELNU|nr:PREDICTED: uncharacterized protein LOC104588977 [Nelumbo nucifera]